jgi:hypothetical protein
MSERKRGAEFAGHVRIMNAIMHCHWESIREDLAHDQPPLATFAGFAAAHHICQPLLARLTLNGALGLLPIGTVNEMQREVERRANRAQSLAELLPAVHATFASAGVTYRTIKGEVFAARYWGSARYRRQGDLDLLVPREMLPQALTSLMSLGFAPRARRVRMLNGRAALRPQLLRSTHALLLRRGDLAIDLHWTLRTAPAYRIDEQRLWQERQDVRVDEVTYPTLTDEYALVLLLLSLEHDIGRGGCRLKTCIDVMQLLRTTQQTMDWPTFFRQRTEENTLRIAVNVLDLVLTVLQCEDEFTELADAMRPHLSSLVLRDSAAKLELFRRRRGSPANKFWVLAVHPVEWRRDARWWIDRSLPHPGRLFGAAGRAARFGVRALSYFAIRSMRRIASPWQTRAAATLPALPSPNAQRDATRRASR